MQSGLIKAICQMGIFMICAQTIVHFRPKASYEKYLKVLVSAMILLQLFLAIGDIFSKEGEAQIAERAKWFAESLEESMQRAADSAFLSDEDMQFQILGEEPQLAQAQESEEMIGEITVQIDPIWPIRVDEISELD